MIVFVYLNSFSTHLPGVIAATSQTMVEHIPIIPDFLYRAVDGTGSVYSILLFPSLVSYVSITYDGTHELEVPIRVV